MCVWGGGRGEGGREGVREKGGGGRKNITQQQKQT